MKKVIGIIAFLAFCVFAYNRVEKSDGAGYRESARLQVNKIELLETEKSALTRANVGLGVELSEARARLYELGDIVDSSPADATEGDE